MNRPKAVMIAVGLCLSILLSGCGSSSTAPVMPLTILTSNPLTSGEANVAYNANVTANGGLAPYAWSTTSGTLPPGLALNSAGSLSGTPTAPGTYIFSVSVTDSQRSPSTASTNLSVTIVPALHITTTSLSNSSVGLSYSAILAATGGFPAYTWSIKQGSLPGGLTLNATSGLISGTPTGTGTSNFTVQVSDTRTPSTSATASLSIAITPAPQRSAALYVGQVGPGTVSYLWDQTGLQIQNDGSLRLLPSSPESAISGRLLTASPTLPILFQVSPATSSLESLLVNPDYSLVSYSLSAPLPGNPTSYRPFVDPTGSNVYLPGSIDSSSTTGVTIFPADGSLQVLGTIAVPNVTTASQVVFTPDGKLSFTQTCTSVYPPQGSILSYSRASDGTLTATATYSLPNYCVSPMAVSPDGKYLATAHVSDVQIYSIANDGTLTPVLPQPFTITVQGALGFFDVTDMVWDQSNTYLIVGTSFSSPASGLPWLHNGGTAVLSFSATALTQTVDPVGTAVARIAQTGSFLYVLQVCSGMLCGGPFGILGFDFQNGQLIPLPGSPYQYGNGLDMVIY